MSFRLPMQLESLTPSPVDAPVSLSKAWRGVLILEGITMADGGTRHELYVTAAETNGDWYALTFVTQQVANLADCPFSRFELWPPSLVVNVTAGVPCLPNLKTWVRANKPVMAMFMPDRLSDPAQHARNKAIFRTFYEVLTEHQIVRRSWCNKLCADITLNVGWADALERGKNPRRRRASLSIKPQCHLCGCISGWAISFWAPRCAAPCAAVSTSARDKPLHVARPAVYTLPTIYAIPPATASIQPLAHVSEPLRRQLSRGSELLYRLSGCPDVTPVKPGSLDLIRVDAIETTLIRRLPPISSMHVLLWYIPRSF
jgi:hypothetical protein